MALPARIRIFFAALLCAGMAFAAPPRGIDRVRIHALYHDGEFERILRELEAYGKGQCACAKDDSIFAEKHLAVVLAAAPATRELGRYHMFRLLDLSPRADLLDMYVGDEVDAVFEKVRKEHDLRASDTVGKTQPAASMAVASPGTAAPRRASLAPVPPPAAAKPPGPSAAPSAPTPKPSEPAYSENWALPAKLALPSRAIAAAPKVRLASRAATAPAKTYTPWDAPLASARASRVDSARARPVDPAMASAAAQSTADREDRAAVASDRAAGLSGPDTSDPVWKKPGVWIGGGAALAAIAFTLWHAGAESAGPGKTYAVPASLSK